jgi:hypothetical protein
MQFQKLCPAFFIPLHNQKSTMPFYFHAQSSRRRGCFFPIRPADV